MSNFRGEAPGNRGEATNFRGAMSNFRGEAPGNRGEATNIKPWRLSVLPQHHLAHTDEE